VLSLYAAFRSIFALTDPVVLAARYDEVTDTLAARIPKIGPSMDAAGMGSRYKPDGITLNNSSHKESD